MLRRTRQATAVRSQRVDGERPPRRVASLLEFPAALSAIFLTVDPGHGLQTGSGPAESDRVGPGPGLLMGSGPVEKEWIGPGPNSLRGSGPVEVECCFECRV